MSYAFQCCKWRARALWVPSSTLLPSSMPGQQRDGLVRVSVGLVFVTFLLLL